MGLHSIKLQFNTQLPTVVGGHSDDRGDLEELAALHRGEMRVDARDRRVKRGLRVDADLVVLDEDAAEEVVRQVRMAAAVPAEMLHDLRRKLRLQVAARVLLDLLVEPARVAALLRHVAALLPPDAARFAAAVQQRLRGLARPPPRSSSAFPRWTSSCAKRPRPWLLEYRFAQYETKSIAASIRDAWLDRAKELLSHPSAKASDVARQLGFTNPKSFHAIFTRETGTPPGAWKRKQPQQAG